MKSVARLLIHLTANTARRIAGLLETPEVAC